MLTVNSLQVAYGDIQVVWDVSFGVPERAIVTLLGPNGAGKSTTLRALMGLLPIKGGRATFAGQSLIGRSTHDIVQSGLVLIPESRATFSTLTILDNLYLGASTARARPHRDATLHEVFQIFPILKERQTQLAGTLSGGEQQMLAIGRGLMARPKLLLLDEPSTGLAPLFVKEMYHQLSRLKEEGLTILLAEQQVPHALAFSERAYVLENGEIRLFGKSKDLLGVPEIQRTYLGVT